VDDATEEDDKYVEYRLVPVLGFLLLLLFLFMLAVEDFRFFFFSSIIV